MQCDVMRRVEGEIVSRTIIQGGGMTGCIKDVIGSNHGSHPTKALRRANGLLAYRQLVGQKAHVGRSLERVPTAG